MPRLPILVAVLALFCGVAPARADLAYVLNSGDGSISVIDSTLREEVRRIPVLREAHHLLLTPATEPGGRRFLMVADSGANELLYFNPDTAEIVQRTRISNPYHLEFTPDGKLLVVTSLRRDQVDIYDAATLALLGRLKVPDKPSHLAFSPDSRFAYVTLQGARGLMAIDLAERKPVWLTEVGPQPAGVTWHNGRLLVGVMGSDFLAVVNPADGRTERAIPIGRGAHTVFPSPDGRLLYATSRVDSRITVLDAANLDVIARWELPGGPDCIAFSPDGRLWVTLRWTARIAVVDPVNGTADILPVGRSPHGIFVQPRQGPLAPSPGGDPNMIAAAPPPAVPSGPGAAPGAGPAPVPVIQPSPEPVKLAAVTGAANNGPAGRGSPAGAGGRPPHALQAAALPLPPPAANPPPAHPAARPVWWRRALGY